MGYHSTCSMCERLLLHVENHFAPHPGHNKDNHKNGTNCFPAWHTDGFGSAA